MIISMFKTSSKFRPKFFSQWKQQIFLKNFKLNSNLVSAISVAIYIPWIYPKIKKYRIYAFWIGKRKTNPKPTTYDFWAKLTKPKSMHNYYG